MADFKKALDKTLHEEQYWTQLDGGTYRGIVHKMHPEGLGWDIIDAHVRKLGLSLRQNEQIHNIHLDALVAAFYRSNFWSPIQGDEIDCQRVAEILFDWTVTSWNDATKALQNIVGAHPDGDLGPITLDAVNAAGCSVADQFQAARIAFYKKTGGLYWRSWVARAKRF
jgi:lysozyme family protein